MQIVANQALFVTKLQILVVVKSAISRESGHSEMFLSYHDIFLRYAYNNQSL